MSIQEPSPLTVQQRAGHRPNEEQTLHRQVHPSWVQEGRITSQAFSPTPKDAGLLSVYDGKQIAAEGSFNHYRLIAESMIALYPM